MITFKFKVLGQFKTDKFQWYFEDTLPRPRQVKDASEANGLLSKLTSDNFALRVITYNTNKYDLDSKIMIDGGKISVIFDSKKACLIADVDAEFNLSVNNKNEEKDLKELLKLSKLSFHIMEIRVLREDIDQIFGPEGGTVIGGKWEDKTSWPAIEILECSLFKKR